MLTIKTNNRPREILTWYDLTHKEQLEFLQNSDDVMDSSFFRYKNWVYDLNGFVQLGKNSPFPSVWSGYHSDSAFSGTLVRYTDCNDAVIVGTYYS